MNVQQLKANHIVLYHKYLTFQHCAQELVKCAKMHINHNSRADREIPIEYVYLLIPLRRKPLTELSQNAA